MKAYHSLHSYRGDSRFSVWLYRIVSNTCLDFLRERKRRAEVPLEREDENGEQEQTDIRDESLSPETLFEQKVTREALRRGLDSLPDDQRKILLPGKRNRQVANFPCPQKTVRISDRRWEHFSSFFVN